MFFGRLTHFTYSRSRVRSKYTFCDPSFETDIDEHQNLLKNLRILDNLIVCLHHIAVYFLDWIYRIKRICSKIRNKVKKIFLRRNVRKLKVPNAKSNCVYIFFKSDIALQLNEKKTNLKFEMKQPFACNSSKLNSIGKFVSHS